VRDVQNVADILVDPEGALERRNHWEKTSHSLLVGAILHVLYAEADKTLAGVANFLSDPRRPIATTLRAMMTTLHLGDRPHPVVASAARELLNKSENERSGVLSTAMSFLGLYRDPVVAKVTRRCDWRIADLVDCEQPATLYLVVPPSDISRTKPLVRLVLNQIGRRLTEELETRNRRYRLLLMLDEFPALGRLDFFETALAFMAGYGLKSFLNCPVTEPDREGLWAEQLHSRQLPCPGLLRDQRRAHGQTRLGRTRHRDRAARHEELCGPSPVAMARTSHDLAPGDGTAARDRRRGDAASAHRRAGAGLGLSPDPRQEGGYYEDTRLKARVHPPPSLAVANEGTSGGRPNRGADDWSYLPVPASVEDAAGPIAGSFSDQNSENHSGRSRSRYITNHDDWTRSSMRLSRAIGSAIHSSEAFRGGRCMSILISCRTGFPTPARSSGIPGRNAASRCGACPG